MWFLINASFKNLQKGEHPELKVSGFFYTIYDLDNKQFSDVWSWIKLMKL